MTAPTPSTLKVLRNTYRKDRANPAEPRPTVGAKAPPWLSRDGPARQAWRRLSRVLTATRVLTVADAEALALGCVALADYLTARADPIGWRRADAAWKRYAAVLRDFGMTPSARTRVASVPVVDRSPLAEWMASGEAPTPTPTPRPRHPRPATAPPADPLAEWIDGPTGRDTR